MLTARPGLWFAMLAMLAFAVPVPLLAANDAESKEATESVSEPASDDAEGDEAAGSEDTDAADSETAGSDDVEVIDPEDAEAAEKELIRRHHEGDVAMGVCGGRLTALMWFYDASVKAGRDDLAGALESVSEARQNIKEEAERRATEDNVPTTVRVMNQHSTDLWEKLVENSEDPEEFQKIHDQLFADVQECLDLFFERANPGAD